jgi:Domain of unknown function (DUF4129)
MKPGRAQVALALFLLSMLVLPAAAAASELSLAEYRQQLGELAAKVDSLADHPELAGKIEAGVPDKVTVKTGQSQITVNNRILKDELAALSRADAEKRPATLAQIQNYVRELRAQAEAYEQGMSQAGDRQKLTDILARREFRTAQGPSSRDLLLSKILSWLGRLLDKLSPSARSRFDPFQILVYLFIGVALIVLALWTVRHLRRPREEHALREIIPFSPSARGWHVWLAEARGLAQQQDWRNAIHLAYWAGISFLEEQGAWRPDRARTPREYLHLVGLRSARYPVLATLTRKFEVVWYGHRDASESDFQETLGQLEKLGCR